MQSRRSAEILTEVAEHMAGLGAALAQPPLVVHRLIWSCAGVTPRADRLAGRLVRHVAEGAKLAADLAKVLGIDPSELVEPDDEEVPDVCWN